MKKSFITGMALFLLGFGSIPAFAQIDSREDLGTYVKNNIAVSKFRILGVTRKQYAKCLETQNYADPDKKLRFVVIDKTSFADDGKGYDLVADDGILTSENLYLFSGPPCTPGSYHETTDYTTVLTDENFAHQAYSKQAGKLIISCKFKFVRCSEMSNPAQAWICNWAGWPYGSFQISECEIKWET